jgi:hypothetical protein
MASHLRLLNSAHPRLTCRLLNAFTNSQSALSSNPLASRTTQHPPPLPSSESSSPYYSPHESDPPRPQAASSAQPTDMASAPPETYHKSVTRSSLPPSQHHPLTVHPPRSQPPHKPATASPAGSRLQTLCSMRPCPSPCTPGTAACSSFRCGLAGRSLGCGSTRTKGGICWCSAGPCSGSIVGGFSLLVLGCRC